MNLITLAAQLATVWYGPATATFDVDFPGNPYDPAVNDVRVLFTSKAGKKLERLAYYDEGAFRAVLVAPEPGEYTATLFRNGNAMQQTATEGKISLKNPMPRGFLRLKNGRFRFDDGTPYVPLGMNLGWQGGNMPDMTATIKQMSENGMNWSRMWACSWDGKNPFIPNNADKLTDGQLWAPALKRWDALWAASEEHEVAGQFVLFHHGLFSSRVNPNWPDHPWNAAKGGFLKNPADFFTDPEAKRRTKLWLRTAVARYAHYTQLMAWELFNEVEWVDARYADRWAEIEAWHAEMADYLRSIDPYGHLITTSSDLRPGLFAKMDYAQSHIYTSNLRAGIANMKFPGGMPGFVGEYGLSTEASDTKPEDILDGIFAGIMSGQAGAGMYWYWDIVGPKNYFGTFKHARAAMDAMDLPAHPLAKPIDLKIRTDLRQDLVIRPGRGWDKSEPIVLNLPDGADGVGQISSYFQSETSGNKDKYAPLKLRFDAPTAGKVQIRFAGISTTGARLKATVNGTEALAETFVQAGFKSGTTREFSFPAGQVAVDITNDGSDWIQIADITVPGLGMAAVSQALTEGSWLAARFTGTAGAEMQVSGLLNPDGDYAVKWIDLTDGSTTKGKVTIAKGAARLKLIAKDAVAVFSPLK